MPAINPRPNRAARRGNAATTRSPFPLPSKGAPPPRQWSARRR